MENQYERFFKLLYSLLGLVMSGARKVQWLCDQFQKIVEIPQPHNVCGLTIEDYWKFANGWEQALSKCMGSAVEGIGEKIMEAVGPFYTTPIDGNFLKPPVPNLEGRVGEALFWRGHHGIITMTEVPSPKDLGHAEFLSESLNDYLMRTVGYDMEGNVDAKLIMDIIRHLVPIFNKLAADFFFHDTGINFTNSSWGNLLTFMKAAVWFSFQKDKPSNFNFLPLMKLCLDGNIPLITANGEVWVLCGKEQ